MGPILPMVLRTLMKLWEGIAHCLGIFRISKPVLSLKNGIFLKSSNKQPKNLTHKQAKDHYLCS
jgi:hypothetical protein